MKNIVILNVDGTVSSFIEYMVAAEELLENMVALDTKPENLNILFKSYYKNNEFKQLPPKPSQYHIWNLQTEQWEEPDGYLQTIRADGNKQINQLSSQKILSKYPIYKQLNIGRTPEAQVMYDWIDNIRSLSNIATASIAQAVTQEEITAIADNFKTELGNIV